MLKMNEESTLAGVICRLRQDQLYLLFAANLLLLVSVVLPQLGFESILARVPGGVGLVMGAWWSYRLATRDLTRSSPEDIFDQVVDDD